MKPAKLIFGESLNVLHQLKRDGAQFDCLLTDPPYSSGALHISGKSQATHKKYQQTQTKTLHPDFSGDSRDQLSWVCWMSCCLNLCRSLLRPGSPVMVFCDWRQLGACVNAMQSGGFVYRGVVVWCKKAGRPQKGRFRSDCEYIVWGSHGPMPQTDLYLPGFYTYSTVSTGNRLHMNQKPVELLCDLLKIVRPGGAVVDPFAGSGSTLEAAVQCGLSAVGIEEDAEIYRRAATRLGLRIPPEVVA